MTHTCCPRINTVKILYSISSHPQHVNLLGFDFDSKLINFWHHFVKKLEKHRFQLHTAIVISQ